MLMAWVYTQPFREVSGRLGDEISVHSLTLVSPVCNFPWFMKAKINTSACLEARDGVAVPSLSDTYITPHHIGNYNYCPIPPSDEPDSRTQTYHCGLWQMVSLQWQFHSCRFGCTVANSLGPKLPPATSQHPSSKDSEQRFITTTKIHQFLHCKIIINCI